MITQFAQKFYTVLRDLFIKVLNAAMQALLSTQQFNSDGAILNSSTLPPPVPTDKTALRN